jgi:hypothetical protein
MTGVSLEATMTGTPAENDGRHTLAEEPAKPEEELFGLEGRDRRAAFDWFGEHLPELRRSAFGDRLLYQSIGFCLVLGLLAHVGGYLLRSNATSDLVELLADLLYALGFSLWTGAVVVLLLDVVPKVKQRQFREALEAYEQAQSGTSDTASADDD